MMAIEISKKSKREQKEGLVSAQHALTFSLIFKPCIPCASSEKWSELRDHDKAVILSKCFPFATFIFFLNLHDWY